MRLIDGEELLARYKARCNGCKETKNYCEHCCDIADIINDIEDAPTIEERKKGKWMDMGDYCVCNQCWHTEQQFNGVEQIPRHTPCCAMCGADMREEKKDDDKR